MDQLIVLAILLAVGYTAGTIVEKKHYKSIEARENALIEMPAVSFEHTPETEANIIEAQMVTGSAVIAVDYFKQLLAGLRNIFGGNVATYESLIDRARREALLRMKESAGGANMIINVRIETSTIGKSSRKQKSTSVEAFAYGTALTMGN